MMGNSDLTEFDNAVMSALTDVCDFKRDTGQYPVLATEAQVMTSLKLEIRESLRRLYRAGLIVHHLDINKNNLFGVKE